MAREEFEQQLQLRRSRYAQTNSVAAIAHADGRDYITPEDVTAAFEQGIEESKVQLDVLTILGNTTGFGVEDRSLTAFIAAEGKK